MNEKCDLLIKHKKFIINIQNNNGNTVLHNAIKMNNLHIVTLLLSHPKIGEIINIQNDLGNTPLHEAILKSNCDIDIIKLLLTQPIMRELRNNNNETPLDIAIKNNNTELITLLQP